MSAAQVQSAEQCTPPHVQTHISTPTAVALPSAPLSSAFTSEQLKPLLRFLQVDKPRIDFGSQSRDSQSATDCDVSILSVLSVLDYLFIISHIARLKLIYLPKL